MISPLQNGLLETYLLSMTLSVSELLENAQDLYKSLN
jgi:hypothetical protein